MFFLEKGIKLLNLYDDIDNFSLKLFQYHLVCLSVGLPGLNLSWNSSILWSKNPHNQECFTPNQEVKAWSFISTLQIVPVSFLEYNKYQCDFRSWDLIYFNLLPSSWRSDTVSLFSLCQASSLLDIVWWDLPQVIQKALSEAFILFFI